MMSLTIPWIVFIILQTIPCSFGMHLCWQTGRKFLTEGTPTNTLKEEATLKVMLTIPIALILVVCNIYIIVTAGFSATVTAFGVAAVIISPALLFTAGFSFMTLVMHFMYPHMARD